jgi:hypothetical protein
MASEVFKVATATPSELSPKPLSERELRLLERRNALVVCIDTLRQELTFVEIELGI